MARAFLTDQLEQWDEQDLVWPAQLVLSELATNSVLHAGTVFTLGLQLLAERVLRIEVSDGSSREPRLKDYGLDATTGRGVALIADIARSWGVQQIPDGKVVWCELSAATDGGDGAGERFMNVGDVATVLDPPHLPDRDNENTPRASSPTMPVVFQRRTLNDRIPACRRAAA